MAVMLRGYPDSSLPFFVCLLMPLCNAMYIVASYRKLQNVLRVPFFTAAHKQLFFNICGCLVSCEVSQKIEMKSKLLSSFTAYRIRRARRAIIFVTHESSMLTAFVCRAFRLSTSLPPHSRPHLPYYISSSHFAFFLNSCITTDQVLCARGSILTPNRPLTPLNSSPSHPSSEYGTSTGPSALGIQQ